MENFQISQLLDKTKDFDKDERYMATSDLCNEFSKNYDNLQIDLNMEKKICSAILKQLDDTSNDVQSIAVKCLGVLVAKVGVNEVSDISTKLCRLILTKENKTTSELRDVYSIGLKTLIYQIPDVPVGQHIAPLLATQLLEGLPDESRKLVTENTQEVNSIAMEVYDILSDLVKRYGLYLTAPQNELLINKILFSLSCERPNSQNNGSGSSSSVKKKATSCLGNLGVVLSDALLSDLVARLLKKLSCCITKEDIKFTLLSLGCLSRSVGKRFAELSNGIYLKQMIEVFCTFTQHPRKREMDGSDAMTDEEESEQAEEYDELRENCLAGLENLVLHCCSLDDEDEALEKEKNGEFVFGRNELQLVTGIAIQFMKYDPNYNYDDENDENDAMSDEEEYSDVSDDDNYSDDDDTSWKVRRASLRLLSALITISSSGDPVYSDCTSMVGGILSELIGRFKEREENVRLDVLKCVVLLLQKCHHVDEDEHKVESIIQAVKCEFNKKGTHKLGMLKSKVLFWSVLSELVKNTKAAKIVHHFEVLLPCMIASLEDVTVGGHGGDSNSHSSLKMESLNYLLVVCTTCLKQNKFQQEELVKYFLDRNILFQSILPKLTQCVQQEWYKITAQALRVIEVLVMLVCGSSFSLSEDMKIKLSSSIFPCVLARFQANDVDQEIKETSLVTMAALLIYLPLSTSSIDNIFQSYHEKINNELTRLTALKALVRLGSSGKMIDIGWPLLKEMIRCCCSFLRQSSRTLRCTSLETLLAFTTIIDVINIDINPIEVDEIFCLMLNESSNLISEADLQLSQIALSLICQVLRIPNIQTSNIRQPVQNQIFPKCFALIHSPVVGGIVKSVSTTSSISSPNTSNNNLTTELIDFFVGYNRAYQNDGDLICKLLSGVDEFDKDKTIPIIVVKNISQCVASLIQELDSECCPQLIQQFLSQISAPATNLNQLIMALYCMGEIGRRRQNVIMSAAEISNLISSRFTTGSEDVKNACWVALGQISSGNLQVYMPLLLPALNTKNNDHQNLYLGCLKEIITCHVSSTTLTEINSSNQLTLYVDDIILQLRAICEQSNVEEGFQNMVAECLGKLCILFPGKLVDLLKEFLQNSTSESGSEFRWTAVTALKYCLTSINNLDFDKTETQRASLTQLFELLQQDFEIFFITPLRSHLPRNPAESKVPASTLSMDVGIRRAALLTLNVALHHQPHLVVSQPSQLKDILYPVLFELMATKYERIVDLGPFKHKVDDGLLLRKATYACFHTILSSTTRRSRKQFGIQLAQLLDPYLIKGLGDSDMDVQMLAQELICKINNKIILNYLPAILIPLEKALFKQAAQLAKATSNATSGNNNNANTNTQMERAADLIRSALRTLSFLLTLTKDIPLLAKVQANDVLNGMFKHIQQEQLRA